MKGIQIGSSDVPSPVGQICAGVLGLLLTLAAVVLSPTPAEADSLPALAKASGHVYDAPTYAYDSAPSYVRVTSRPAGTATLLQTPAYGARAEAVGSYARHFGSAYAAETADAAGDAGQYVYRVHGGEARPLGRSWTPEDPRGMANPRDVLGLPKANSGQYLSKARVLNDDDVLRRSALPIEEDGVHGGGLEWVFPDPAGQLEVHWTIPLDPPW